MSRSLPEQIEAGAAYCAAEALAHAAWNKMHDKRDIARDALLAWLATDRADTEARATAAAAITTAEAAVTAARGVYVLAKKLAKEVKL